MSSKQLRIDIKNYISANSAETVVDLSGEYRTLIKVAGDNSITPNDNWVAIQFLGSEEEPIDVQNMCFREFGSIFVHVIAPIQPNVVENNLIDRTETLRALFRGKRINDIVIESVSPLNTEGGTTLEFDNSFTSGTFFINYYRDIKGA